MIRAGAVGLAMLLAGCGKTVLPQPADGYDAVLFKQRVMLRSAIDTFEIPSNTPLVANKMDRRGVFYCGLGVLNTAPAEICVLLKGQTLTVEPGGLHEITTTIPAENIVHTKA